MEALRVVRSMRQSAFKKKGGKSLLHKLTMMSRGLVLPLYIAVASHCILSLGTSQETGMP